MKLETRAVDSVTADEGKITGRAIVFNRQSVDFGDWVEIIEPGAVELMPDLYLDFDHQSQYILARESNATLTTAINAESVDFTAVPPNTTWAQDVLESLRGRYIAGCSFSMECIADKWEWVEDHAVRFIQKCRVYSLTVTGIPAYPDTAAEARDAAKRGLPETAKARLAELRAGDEPARLDENKDDGTEPRSGEDEGHSPEKPETFFYSEHLGLMKETNDEA
jgi:HK97 family phage prohead protease